MADKGPKLEQILEVKSKNTKITTQGKPVGRLHNNDIRFYISQKLSLGPARVIKIE